MDALAKIQAQIGGIDIYLLDQILKNRYLKDDVILDAGCGNGRNLKWFYNNAYHFYGIDNDVEKITALKKSYPKIKEHFSTQCLDKVNFENEAFNHVICNAVLHFAKSEAHFMAMFSELIRVLKPKGSLFIRMTSNFGIENNAKQLPNKNTYWLPDNTERFLLTNNILQSLTKTYSLTFLEPVKTVNVGNLRCMTTLVFQK